jgi:hypothetical protein
MQRKIFQMPETLTEERLYHLMRKAGRQATLMDVIMLDAQDNSLEIKREETKQLELQLMHEKLRLQETTKQERIKANHQYRMEQLKQVNQSTLPVVPDIEPHQPAESESVGEHDTAMIDQTELVVAPAPALTPASATAPAAVAEPLNKEALLNKFIRDHCIQGFECRGPVKTFLSDFQRVAKVYPLAQIWLNNAMQVRGFPRQKLPNFDADGKRPIVYIGISSNVQNSGWRSKRLCDMRSMRGAILSN